MILSVCDLEEDNLKDMWRCKRFHCYW